MSVTPSRISTPATVIRPRPRIISRSQSTIVSTQTSPRIAPENTGVGVNKKKNGNGGTHTIIKVHSKSPRLLADPNSVAGERRRARSNKVKQLREVISKNNQNNNEPTNSLLVQHRHPNGQLKPGFPALIGAGAPLANQNPHNGRIVKQAFMSELAKVLKRKGRADTKAGLEALAAKVISWALKGSLPAAREVFDRVDGKPAQTIVGDPENPIIFKNVTEMTDEELEQVARGLVINGTAERMD